jgi:hypothetical protein
VGIVVEQRRSCNLIEPFSLTTKPLSLFATGSGSVTVIETVAEAAGA